MLTVLCDNWALKCFCSSWETQETVLSGLQPRPMLVGLRLSLSTCLNSVSLGASLTLPECPHLQNGLVMSTL